MKKKLRWAALALWAALLPWLAGPAAAEADTAPIRYAALTFDDGPTCALTEQLLDGLKRRCVPATFFLCGYRVQACPDTVRRMAEEGHELAVHGMTHTYLHNQSAACVRKELEDACALIEASAGVRPRLFRPPGGLESETLRQEAARQGLPLILWSVDPEDWATADTAAVVRRVVGRVRDGDVILMHDLSPSSIAAALQIVDLLEDQGWQFCTVSELAALRGVSPEPGVSYRSFPPPAQTQS